MADYLKSIGFHMFVKPDCHFLNQLPKPSGLNVSFNARESFALGWQVAERLGMPAFTLIIPCTSGGAGEIPVPASHKSGCHWALDFKIQARSLDCWIYVCGEWAHHLARICLSRVANDWQWILPKLPGPWRVCWVKLTHIRCAAVRKLLKNINTYPG